MTIIDEIYRYEILSRDTDDRPKPISEKGGLSLVYKARDLLEDRVVALKLIREEALSKQSKQIKTSFFASAVVGARLGKESIHIARVFDLGQLGDDGLYMAEEWVDGGDISDLCGQMSLHKVKSTMLQICDAVRVAHANGVAHCDIAPWNILYDTSRDRYVLTDFGLLRILNETTLVLSGKSLFAQGGRQDFMPVEHFHNQSLVGYSTDIYAMGVTMYFLLTGNLPQKDTTGRYITPGEILVAAENRKAPFRVNQIFENFVVLRKDNHTIEAFADRVSKIPT